jgi:hypothetical protein
MTRIWTLSIAFAPALVLVCIAWLLFHVGIAAVFTFAAGAFSGYVARWLDEPAPKHSVKWSIFP